MAENRPVITPVREGFNLPQQSPGNLDISEGDERALMFEKTFAEVNTLGNFAYDLYDNAYSIVKQEPKLSVDEANQRYGVPGLLLFNEPITAGLAASRKDRALKAKERDTLLAQESVDNNTLQNLALFGSAAGAVLLDPVNYINVTGGLASFLKAGRVASLLSKAGFSDDVLRFADDALKGGYIPQIGQAGNVGLGFARGAIDVGLPNLASEIGFYQTAMNNGYDYDVQSAVGFGLGATGLGGALGAVSANMAYRSMYKSIGAFNDINSATSHLFTDTFAYLDNAPKLDLLDREVLETLITKHTNDLFEGKIPSVKTTQALLTYSNDQRLVTDFIDNVRSGKYAGVIDEETAKLLSAGDIKGLKAQGLDFKAWVMSALDETITSNKFFRGVIDNNIIQKYTGRINNVKQVGEVIVGLKNEISDLSRQINELQIKINTSSKKAVPNLFEKKKVLETQLDTLIKDYDSISSYKSKIQNERLEKFLQKAELKDYTNTSSSVFISDYKKLVKRIKDRKSKSQAQWNNMSEKAREDLYALFEMVNPRLSREPSLDDLLGFTNDELIALHQDKILTKELGAMSREESLDYLKREILNPELERKRLARESLQELEATQKIERNLTNLEPESLEKEIDDLLEFNDLKGNKEFMSELKAIDDEIAQVELKGLAEQAAYNCLKGKL